MQKRDSRTFACQNLTFNFVLTTVKKHHSEGKFASAGLYA
jgi:hypothetical protein